MKNGSEIVEKPSVKSRQRIVLLSAALGVLILFLIAAIYVYRQKSAVRERSARNDASSYRPDSPYQKALLKVEQDRGEPVGNKAKINVPAELKLYKDRNRFLAIQVAESLKQKYEIPRDFAEFAVMVGRGEFESLPVIGEGYIIYGVGLKADDELTTFDEKTGKSIPLFATEAELEEELGRLKDSLQELEEKAQGLKKDLAQVSKGDRKTSRDIQGQISDTQKSADIIKKRRELIDSFYKSDEHRRLMIEEYARLAELSGNFNGRSFNLQDAASRKEFKIALLSMLRPAARARLEEIGQAYQQKFDRPLPVTSLVRTREYQKYLGESGNPNAVSIDIPPHTTGLAFDIYTYYMTAEEQTFLMDEIARLKREGKVEALRENRDHIHVFAFADGEPPDEALVKNAFRMMKSN